jgi:hypothetical protein
MVAWSYQQCGSTWYQPQGAQYIVGQSAILIVRLEKTGKSEQAIQITDNSLAGTGVIADD